ncbi:nuclear factor 7, brain-like [Paramisgurnus dabryanus]|uniref:nuclear factor 7, brain-like n=1 Tax=Paramisgurnus dabryanus TaxID=90735 RepID=UPI0031F45B00
MASSGDFLSDEQLTCSICLDVFTDPVTTACGHNFCMDCIRRHRDASLDSKCPLCGFKLDLRTDFKINTTMKEIAEGIKRKRIQESEVTCDSCPKKKRIAVKSCLDCETSFCESHLEPHKTAKNLMKHKLINPVENLDDYICRKHQKPLELYCKDDQTPVCTFCVEGDHRAHNTIQIEKYSLNLVMNEKSAVQQKIQDRGQKIKEIRHSIRFNKQAKEKEIEENSKLFKDVFEKCNAELKEEMEEKHTETERRAKELINELEQEIMKLKEKQTKLEQLSHPLDFIQIIKLQHDSLCNSRSTDISISVHEHGAILRKTISQLQNRLDEKLRETVSRELRSIQRYAVDVTFDPDTAYHELMLSDDRKKVWNAGIHQKVPENPECFDYCSCVLGKEGFSSQNFYYEVDVRGKTEWDLGVVTESANRKGEIGLNPENGYWTVWLRKTDEYAANDVNPVSLTLKEKPVKVGVFVDFERGLISFYDVEAKYHIYSFTGQTFAEKLYPYFSPGEYEEGENSQPMIITPVEFTE